MVIVAMVDVYARSRGFLITTLPGLANRVSFIPVIVEKNDGGAPRGVNLVPTGRPLMIDRHEQRWDDTALMGYERDNIQWLTAYTPGEQPPFEPGQPVVKLNTNENPYPPPGARD